MMERIYSIAWSPNGRWLAAGGNNDKIQIWDVGRESILVTGINEH
jgi:WD40 repeat protein